MTNLTDSKSIAFMVTTPPHNNNTATAITIVEAALANTTVDVLGVFFYQDGVLNASDTLSMPNDELQAIKAWRRLAETYKVPLHLCVTAGEKRGLCDEIEAEADIKDNNSKNTTQSQLLKTNISKNFTVAGLGELVELTVQADRFIQL